LHRKSDLAVLPLNFNHLYYFYVVAKRGSFSQAAADLRIAQSSISVQIKQFEASLGHTLFNRIKTGVELTESGQILFQYADDIFHDIGRIQDALQAVEHQIRGSISIGTVPSAGIYTLPPVLREFQREYPEVKISVDLANTADVVEWVKLGKVDFGILTSNRQYPTLTAEPLMKSKLFLVAPPDHPLAAKETVSPADLETYPFLGFYEGLEIRVLMDALFRRMALSVQYAMESSNVAAVKHMALAGLGLAILPEAAVGEEIRRGQLVRLDIPAMVVAQEITLYHKSSRPVTPTRRRFVDVLREQLSGKRPHKR
jgi:DNA-binding transcriptional LysR family regulator